MASARSLNGTGVVVTRPAHQADALCRLIEERGGRAIRFPVLEILPPRDTTQPLALIDRLDGFEFAIFISANAVERGLDLVLARRAWPTGLARVAIGQATARALARRGLPADLTPPHDSSEALLEMPRMQTVAGQRTIIFRGEGGRELLGDTLRRRGAEVSYAEVYRRALPANPPDELSRRWAGAEIHAFTVTSAESLQNLFVMIGEADRPRLLSTPLVVVSARAARLAERLGWRTPPVLAAAASDEAIVAALVDLASRSIQALDGET